jgi:DNA-binding response OmpR family regulator
MSTEPQILVADDAPGFLKAMTVRLQREGYSVVVASDGYFALDFAVEHKPDLLILDVCMPAGDGFTVQDRKDELPALADVPVIYVSGDKSDQRPLRAERGATILHKPFHFDEMLDLVERALTSRVA